MVLGVHVRGDTLRVLGLLGKFYVVGKIDIEAKFIHLNLGMCGRATFDRRRLLVLGHGSPVCQQNPGCLGTGNIRNPRLNDNVVLWVVFFLCFGLGHSFKME